ncbi:MAG: hypothetical protein WC319_13890 [Candidatus Paceibacterota bacterium]
MKTLKSSVLVVAFAFWSILFTSCKKDDPDDSTPTVNNFVRLENPYLINPLFSLLNHNFFITFSDCSSFYIVVTLPSIINHNKLMVK